MPCLVRSAADGEIRKITLGHTLLDDYLVFVAARARTNTWLAVAYEAAAFPTLRPELARLMTTQDFGDAVRALTEQRACLYLTPYLARCSCRSCRPRMCRRCSPRSSATARRSAPRSPPRC
jgi:hypothetical protein